MWVCKHCLKSFDFIRATDKANHTKHCIKNPNRLVMYAKNKIKINEKINIKLGPYQDFEVICKACEKTFKVRERFKQHPVKSQYFCSRMCANSVGGKKKAELYHHDGAAQYTTVAWRHHEKICVVCGEDKIVAVHHMNHNHHDNTPSNLVPLCPTHHQYMHSRYKHLIEDKVNKYIENKWACGDKR